MRNTYIFNNYKIGNEDGGYWYLIYFVRQGNVIKANKVSLYHKYKKEEAIDYLKSIFAALKFVVKIKRFPPNEEGDEYKDYVAFSKDKRANIFKDSLVYKTDFIDETIHKKRLR